MSLLRRVPSSRTCEDAEITNQFCVCRNSRPLRKTDPNVRLAVATAVKHINTKLLNGFLNVCRKWYDPTILFAQVTTGVRHKRPYEDFLVSFDVEPNRARFEATLHRYNTSNTFVVEETIFRASLYGSTSHCVDTVELKNYCYCKDQLAP